MDNILESLDSPEKLKSLSIKELKTLAAEIREEIKNVVSRNGGHLATNLGIVEITLVLHRLFDFRKDRLVFDVGHQCYTHKIITGRKKVFPSIRTMNGLSGYPSRRESEYDTFNAGHAGTSISAGLGLACGDEIQHTDRRIVALIGDGSIPTGLSFEGLNQLGHLQKNMIIILNDNEMAISRTVGALAHHLTRIRTGAFYNENKKRLHNILRKLPLGKKVNEIADHVSSSLIGGFLPGHFFNELGLRYFGPIDGHSFNELENVISNCTKLGGPIIVHAVTTKGHGYKPAKDDPEYFHGAKPFNINDGSSAKPSDRRSYSSMFADKITSLARENSKIVAITAAMSTGTGLSVFREKFPERFFDVGICEQHAVTFGGGLSEAGLKPVVAIYSSFLQRSYDQLFHDISMQEDMNILFAIDRAGLVGSDGFSHHGLLDISMLRTLPNFALMAPRDGQEFEKMVEFAVTQTGIFALRYPREIVPDVFSGFPCPEITMGTGEIITEGERIVVLGYGATVARAFQAHKSLEQDGVSITVANARFAKPLDISMLRALSDNHDILITVEDHNEAGGFGSGVTETCMRENIAFSNIHIMGVPDSLVDHAPRSEQIRKTGLDEQGIIRTVKKYWEKL